MATLGGVGIDVFSVLIPWSIGSLVIGGWLVADAWHRAARIAAAAFILGSIAYWAYGFTTSSPSTWGMLGVLVALAVAAGGLVLAAYDADRKAIDRDPSR